MGASLKKEAPGATGMVFNICVGMASYSGTMLPHSPMTSVTFKGHTVDGPATKKFSSTSGLVSGTKLWGWPDPLDLCPLTNTAPLQQHMSDGELRVRVRMTCIDSMQL